MFGTHIPPPPPGEYVQPIERVAWGDLIEVNYEPEEDIEEEIDEELEESSEILAAEVKKDGTHETTRDGGGLMTPSGLSSIPAGLETPDDIELRKDQRRTITTGNLPMDNNNPSKQQLYRVLQEKEV